MVQIMSEARSVQVGCLYMKLPSNDDDDDDDDADDPYSSESVFPILSKL